MSAEYLGERCDHEHKREEHTQYPGEAIPYPLSIHTWLWLSVRSVSLWLSLQQGPQDTEWPVDRQECLSYFFPRMPC